MDVLVKYTIVACGAACFAFGSDWFQLGVLLLFVVAGTLKKKHVIGITVLYHFLVVFPIFVAAYDYSTSIAYSAIAFVVPFILNAGMLGLALLAKEKLRPFALIGALILLSVPPLSVYSVVSPLPLAGLVFPGTGELGIFLFITLCACLTIFNKIKYILPILFGLSVAQSTTAGMEIDAMIGIQTSNGVRTEVVQAAEFQLDRYTQLEIAESQEAHIVVFPESAFGEWHPDTQKIMQTSTVGIYGGARIRISNSTYVNALVDARTGFVIYQQEFPIPLKQSGRLSAVKGVNTLNNYPAVLICNEIINPWQSYKAFNSNKTQVVWIANFGWTERRFISERMKSNARHYARLFDKELVVAVNTHD